MAQGDQPFLLHGKEARQCVRVALGDGGDDVIVTSRLVRPHEGEMESRAQSHRWVVCVNLLFSPVCVMMKANEIRGGVSHERLFVMSS